ncbi:AEC family transporter [Pseudodesulfovibrio piezophilus]|uniref:Auxin Efflux Carrier n=1 Tax=Pseudodesulfovibrio piezophilus (strain DSM 21447 / JCM 15486 / C1TLV30) TaxID=1322246 RepID=M1WKM2_PSEP2|nr:AEC family transporter [Pseudodesulfovibrio piezophilus]CCH49846.1 Auxin Efflux Carrier [Pseudodesulfovibrio piezophilus C1TLV30]
MSPIALAIAPIFGLILLGFILFRLDFPGTNFWPVSERLTYYVLFPALLVGGLVGRNFDDSATMLAAAVFLTVCFAAGGLLFLRSLLKMTGPAFTSVFQGAIRPNTYVGLSAAAALLGPHWMALSAVVLLTLIPLVNVLCVLVLSRHGTPGEGTKRIVLELAKNPLILACVLGFFLNGFSVPIPLVLHDLLSILGKAALPLGLLAVGAGLRFDGVREQLLPVTIASGVHLILLPLVAWGLCVGLGVEGSARDAALIYTAIPVSVSAFILARQMGGDHRVMAMIITMQTVLSAVSLPLVLAVLGSGS